MEKTKWLATGVISGIVIAVLAGLCGNVTLAGFGLGFSLSMFIILLLLFIWD